MQNQMTICPPIVTNNNSKQYDSTKSPLALLEQTCRSIGADTLSNNKSSSQSIDHTKKDNNNGSHSLNKLHLNLNGYKPSNLAINQHANLTNNYEGGRRSGNSASISPASSLDKNTVSYSANAVSNGSRPNSNNGNSRPNSNSSLTGSKSKELSKLSFKPYEEQHHSNNSDRKKHHSPELEHLKLLNKSERKSSDCSTNGLVSKNSANSLSNVKTNPVTTSTNLNYAAQQQLLEQHLQYQQYMAALAAGYPFNNPSLMAAAAALADPMLPASISSSASSRNSNSSSNIQQQNQTHQSTPPSLPSTHPNLMPPQSSPNHCPPGCNSCLIHNPLLSSFAAAASSSVSSSNHSNPFSSQHLAALSSQYPHLPPQFLHLYNLASYNPSSLGGPPVTSASSPATTHSLNNSQSQQSQPTNRHSTNSNHNQLSMHHHSSLANSSNHSNHNSITSNKSAPQICAFMNLNGTFCGKRFNNPDEYLIHLKSHTLNDFPNLNSPSLESLYGSYEAMLSNSTGLANLRRPTMHDSLSSTRFHPYGRPSSTAANHNYPHNSQNSATMSPAALSALSNSQTSLSQFPLGALSSLNGLSNNLNSASTNPAALAAAFNLYSQYNGRVGPTVQP